MTEWTGTEVKDRQKFQRETLTEGQTETFSNQLP